MEFLAANESLLKKNCEKISILDKCKTIKQF